MNNRRRTVRAPTYNFLSHQNIEDSLTLGEKFKDLTGNWEWSPC